MFTSLLNNLFNKKNTKKKNILTIINKNRNSQSRYIYYMTNKNERQNSCLSKYFENLSGLNLSDRNVYYKIF